ncbi:MAG: flagellar protein FlaG [Massilia sp.]|jgi:flagellar protein FlaG|nr:flagellar protein FlaG [Massilia sp.]MDB5949820.1 flagellar protein FlaG [Massilia sp.]
MNISQISSSASPPAAVERKPGIDPQAASVAKARSEGVDAVKDQSVQEQQQLPEALKRINTVLQVRAPGLEFSIDEDSARSIVKVVDTDTNEVIRQMPSKEALEISKALEHLDSLLIRDKA